MALLFALLLLQVDPADQLRRQELALRLSELADAEKPDGFVRAVQRELRGPRIDPGLFADCWRPLVRRRGEGTLDALIAAWDKAAVEAPTPARLLYRAKLEDLASRPKLFRDRLEEAAKKFPAEPTLLWHLGKARFDAGDRGPAAAAFEQMAAQKGAVYDLPDFHRYLVQCYAETERPWAAIEHLRAAKDEDLEAVELARLAAKCKLPAEAARLYRIALAEEPARISLRMGLIVALNAGGERAQAAAERAQLFTVDGKFSKSKVQDYFLLLPNEGRAEEIVRTIRDFAGEPLTILVETTPVESRTSVLAEWERTVQDGRDWAQLGKLKRAWGTAEESLAVLKRGEALFPKDPWILRESIEGLAQAGEFKEAAAAYARLVDLDPDGSKTGARPYPWLRRALEDLSLKDIASALPLATRLLAEPGLDEKEAQLVRAALRPGWDLSGADFWTQMKKTPFPKPPKALDQSLRTQIERLSSEEFDDRAAAFVELKKAGLAGIPVLLERIDDPDAEIRSRCREAIRAILTD